MIYEVEFALSYFDLILVDGFKDAWTSQNKKMIDAILYHNGMDVEKGYEVNSYEHRTLTGKRVNGPRFEGLERLDSAWTQTGAASLDAIIAGTSDTDMRITMRKMSKQRIQEAVFDQ